MALITTREIKDVYVDESLHVDLGIAVVALVFGAAAAIEPAVDLALQLAGLRPGTDEFKSTADYGANAHLRQGRDQLLGFTATGTALAVGVVPLSERPRLGRHALAALKHVAAANGVAPEHLQVHLDEGLFPKPGAGPDVCRDLGLELRTLHAAGDSVATRGLQVADLVANVFARIIREEVTGQVKMIADEQVGREDMPLSWELKMRLRWALFAGPHEIPGLSVDEPIVSVYPYAVYADGLAPAMHAAVRSAFATAWLGCLS